MKMHLHVMAKMKISMVIAYAKARFEAVARVEPEPAVRLLKELGFDGVEFSVLEPEEVLELSKIANQYGLEVPAVGTGLNYLHYGLSLTAPDGSVRVKAREKIEKIIKAASRSNVRGVIIGLMRGKADEWESLDKPWSLLLEEMRIIAERALNENVLVYLEPLNRYESRLINRVEEGVRFLEELGAENVYLLLDTFHMNIEERSIEESIRFAGGRIGHFHVADSNRLAPGMGHLDFVRVLHALKDTGYTGFISAEIQAKPDLEASARMTLSTLRTALEVIGEAG